MKQPPPKALFILPNLFTASSIFCGLYAIFQAIGIADDRFYRASIAILFAVVFDSLDGRVARLTKTQTAFGIQFDSLADLVSFGVAPAVLVYRWSLAGSGWLGLAVAFAYVTCGALRLARFNLLAASPNRSGQHFVGLPIPLAAAWLASLVLLHFRTGGLELASQYQPLALGALAGLAGLMVSSVPYRSFKKLGADRRTLPLLLMLLGGLLFAAWLTSFALMFVLVTTGLVAAGLAQGLVGLARRLFEQTPPQDLETTDEEETPEEESLF